VYSLRIEIHIYSFSFNRIFIYFKLIKIQDFLCINKFISDQLYKYSIDKQQLTLISQKTHTHRHSNANITHL
jgi:hypothetical protein